MREWFRPPRQLLVILLLLTVASVSALLWSGWRLTQQESAVEAQRSRERLDLAADRIAALLRANLAETGERLAAAAAAPSPAPLKPEPDLSLLLVLSRNRLSAYPAARLVETDLNFGRMEDGARRYRLEETDAGEVVAGVVREIEPDLAASGRRIEVSRPSGACPVQADPEALALAVRNLIDNALKYSPDKPAVFVSWDREDDDVAIRVRDDGMGIPASEQRVIFQKFVQGRGAIAANVKGTGVGLAMVSHIMRAHGGGIRVDSTPGEGSTFTLRLPLRRSHL